MLKESYNNLKKEVNKMSKKEKYQQIVTDILKEIGGKENIIQATHCMTRLRLNLKDMGIPNDENVKEIPGVLGVMRAGGQYQIIIGQTVNDVYDVFTDVASLSKQPTVEELNEEDIRKDKGIKGVFNSVLNKISGSLTPLIPLLVASAMFKMFIAILGTGMLNVIQPADDLYKALTIVGDAGFYFLPVVIGYTAAKQFNTSPIMGMLLGAIMLDPNYVNIVTAGKPFSVYGIPVSLTNYGSTIVPILLSVWIMSYIYRFLNKYIPASLRTIFSPTLTMIIMLPLVFCVLGPLGGFLGDYICNAILSFGKLGGIATIIGVAIVGALWEFLVITGMHLVMISAMMLIFSQGGYDNFVTLGAVAASLAVAGMSLGAALRLKDKQEKSLALSFVVASLIGGVTEPALYGVAIRYKRPFIGMMIGGFCGGLYAALTHITAYVMVPVANFLALTAYVGGNSSNLINGIISGVIAFVVAAIATYILGVKPKGVE